MFLKQLNKIIQNVSLASRIEMQDRRQDNSRRRLADRRQEARIGESLERRQQVERRL